LEPQIGPDVELTPRRRP